MATTPPVTAPQWQGQAGMVLAWGVVQDQFNVAIGQRAGALTQIINALGGIAR